MARAESRGDIARSERIASSASRRRPNDQAVRYLWADLHATRGELDRAERVIRDAPGRNFDDYWLQWLLALVRHQGGDQAGTERIARDLIEREPGTGDAWYLLAGVSADRGRY